MYMKYLIGMMFAVVVSCSPSIIRPETVDLDRDERWNRCRFYVIDHECGMLDESEHQECALEQQSHFLAESGSRHRQRYWLRDHGCPMQALE